MFVNLSTTHVLSLAFITDWQTSSDDLSQETVPRALRKRNINRFRMPSQSDHSIIKKTLMTRSRIDTNRLV